ncbi:hypothetical protein LVD17_05185 [Fulvivirga ulvae]|uniref:hypothetical protein n=1 Tax=Fulvivirga ulvae TaxID=2904245 RepID=UPI001F1E17E6|nr:hypothetical protein [Fulvivirga ulvae]UII33216.1 hypothetical protein LVD17_05185 [Fulvivirga ulvae]
MAGGAGHIYDMMARLRNNGNLLSKPGYFKMKEIYLKVSKKEHLIYRKASAAQLQQVRSKIIKERRTEVVRIISVVIISIVVSAAFLSFAVYSFMRYYR